MVALVLVVALALAQAPRHLRGDVPGGPLRVNLLEQGDGTRDDADALAFQRLAVALERANPGVHVGWFAECGTLSWAPATQRAIVFVQTVGGRVRSWDGEDESDYAVGDLLVLDRGPGVRFDPPAGVLVFTLPAPAGEPDDLPWIIRPDWDPRITDTPGGCATDEDAYRRILLTWEREKGPYVLHGLNAHRVRITDSFTHYHPLEGGFDELYLVQDAAPGAHLWYGERLEPFLDPDAERLGESSGLLRRVPVEKGDLIWLPRGTVHRGVGGILAQVIALPGFVPDTEIGVDDAILRINALLGEGHPLSLPYHGGPPYVEVGLERERFDLSVDGRPFASYRSSDDPCFFPVLNPAGARMTRAFPFEQVEGEARDHPHHRSLWFAHGAVNGIDFWHEGPEVVRETRVGPHASGPGRGSFETGDDWLAPDGRLVGRDRRRFEAFALDDAWGLDVDVTLLATDEPLVLGDTKEGTLAIRLAGGLTVDGSEGRARLVNSEGQSGKDAWGKRARWVLASGVVDGEPAAVALMDHPANLRHPTTWHARTYGLVAANPFGLSDFEGAPKGAGDHAVPPGGSLRLRYRVLLFAGVPSRERLDALFADFAGR